MRVLTGFNRLFQQYDDEMIGSRLFIAHACLYLILPYIFVKY